MPVNWEILHSSHPHKKTDAFTARFDITVPKDSEVAVAYRVRSGDYTSKDYTQPHKSTGLEKLIRFK